MLFLAVTVAIGIVLVAGVWLSRAGMAGPQLHRPSRLAKRRLARIEASRMSKDAPVLPLL